VIFTVAIDGPAASGKGTISRELAERFGFRHLDTGLLYRAVGVAVLDGAEAEEAALRLLPGDLADTDRLRSAEAAEAASRVAVRPEVREALVAFQRKFARFEGGAVLDGRDIGTVICPEAEVKLFVTASPEARAARRHAELVAAGAAQTLAEVLEDVRVRDARDAGRKAAPLAAAEDAVTLDTTELSIAEATARAVALVEARLPG